MTIGLPRLLTSGATPLGPGPKVKYLLETYCWGQAPKVKF